MPDRSIAPAILPIERIALEQAQEMGLDNGISLFYLNAGEQPVMRLEIIFKAGKWFETKPGLSFFTGKMLTEGTKTKSASELSEYFDELGTFLEVIPGFDRVTLTIHLLSKHLSSVLPQIAEMINTPAFRAVEFENIKQLKKQRLLVDLEKTSFVAAQKFTSTIFGESNPYGKLLEVVDIENTEVNDLSEFFLNQFKGNFDIAISGSITETDLEQINHHLGRGPKSHPPEAKVQLSGYKKSKSLVEKEDSLQSSVRIGSTFINRNHPDYIEMLVVNEVLGGYFGSRLMRNIREDKGYTYGIHSGISCLKHGSLWAVATDVKKEFRDQTVAEIVKEIRILQNEPITTEELDTVKNYMLGTLISQVDTPFALMDKFKTLHYSGLGYEFFQRYFKTLNSITGKRVQELAKKHLVIENMTQVIVG